MFSLKISVIFAIIPCVGNNFKSKIFFLLKQIYGGLSQDSIWEVGDLTEPYTDLDQFYHIVSWE